MGVGAFSVSRAEAEWIREQRLANPAADVNVLHVIWRATDGQSARELKRYSEGWCLWFAAGLMAESGTGAIVEAPEGDHVGWASEDGTTYDCRGVWKDARARAARPLGKRIRGYRKQP